MLVVVQLLVVVEAVVVLQLQFLQQVERLFYLKESFLLLKLSMCIYVNTDIDSQQIREGIKWGGGLGQSKKSLSEYTQIF